MFWVDNTVCRSATLCGVAFFLRGRATFIPLGGITMTAKVANGKLTITIDLDAEPTPSSTGKMLMYRVCPWTDLGVQVDGVPIRAMVQVGCKNPDYGK